VAFHYCTDPEGTARVQRLVLDLLFDRGYSSRLLHFSVFDARPGEHAQGAEFPLPFCQRSRP